MLNIPAGWKLVPIEPTETMVVCGFESRPDPVFSKPEDWEAFAALTGCQQAAHKARLCYAAMLDAAPSPASVAPGDAQDELMRPLIGSAAPAAGDALDSKRLDWLEQHNGRFYNKDRISSIVGTGFLVAGDERGVRHQTVRAAIDAAMAALAAQVPQQGEA